VVYHKFEVPSELPDQGFFLLGWDRDVINFISIRQFADHLQLAFPCLRDGDIEELRLFTEVFNSIFSAPDHLLYAEELDPRAFSSRGQGMGIGRPSWEASCSFMC
jgi:hypothetical protein